MPKLIIDGEEKEVSGGITLIQACEQAGVEIPRFCFHERLSIAGNCRMCLVEVVGMPKAVASCAMGVNDLRPPPSCELPEIKTKSELVRKARTGVMEFLLINHPLDCPICDQGGECDLQDQAMAYGSDASRFKLNKRAVEDKTIGPLIKTQMTRCIHCTRCVRFMTEVAGVEELGATGRGEDVEIVTYLERGLSSELSGNVIDLCPVGALTSKPFAFTARPWELRKAQSIDVMDAVGSNVRLDMRGREVMRIMPRNHDGVNEEWISDKTRFHWDGLKTQRLDQPYIRKEGRLEPASWTEAFQAIGQRIKETDPERAAVIVGDLAACEEIFALKDLATQLGWKNIECRQNGVRLSPDSGRASYLFNSTIEGIDQADAILLIGSNPRYEASVINARIRKTWRLGQSRIGLIGAAVDLTYPYEHLGAGPESLMHMVEEGGAFYDYIEAAHSPMIIVGEAALERTDGEVILATAVKLAIKVGAIGEDQDWNGFNILQTRASAVGALDLGFVPGTRGMDIHQILDAVKSDEIDFVYLLGADEIEPDQWGRAFVVYQGSHGDRGAHRADVILPGAAYTEKSATYVNIEGRPQMTVSANFPPGEAKEDWTILRALSDHLGKRLSYDNLPALRAVMYEAAPHLSALDTVEAAEVSPLIRLAGKSGRIMPQSFDEMIKDYYLTNPIARASKIMAEMSALQLDKKSGATGTHG